MNEIQNAILSRRSTRGFTAEPLNEQEIRALVDAALASPTARNLQDWHFCFVQDKALLSEFNRAYLELETKDADAEKKAKFENYDVLFGAPLFIIITLPEQPRSNFAEVDAGIAVENLALSAMGLGLGSVIVGRPKIVFNGSEGAAWEKRCGFPEGHHFSIGIVIGHNCVTKDAHPIGEEKISFIG